MRNKFTFLIAFISILIGSKIKAQTTETITVSITGYAKISQDATDNSGITVQIKSYYIGEMDIFGVDTTITTDATGKYTADLEIVIKLCSQYGCLDNIVNNGAIPLYLIFSKNSSIKNINENIPITVPFSDFSYTISKIPILKGYVPQIGLVTVDTAINKAMIIWERNDSSTIVSYDILKAENIVGPYSVIGNILQSADTSVFRDMQWNPAIKSFYKIRAVYTDNSKSPESFPKAPLSLSAKSYNEIQNLTFFSKEDIPVFDHDLYKTIKIYRSIGKSKIFEEIKSFDIETTKGAAYTEMLMGIADDLHSLVECKYLAIGEMYDLIYTDKTHMKSDSGPFSQSMSNLAESELENAPENNLQSLNISPNPSKGDISILIPEKGIITIYNSLGVVIETIPVEKGIFTTQIMNSGIYLVVLNTNTTFSSQVIID